MKKFVSILMVVLMSATLLAGCGGTTEPTPAPTDAGTATDTPTDAGTPTAAPTRGSCGRGGI